MRKVFRLQFKTFITPLRQVWWCYTLWWFSFRQTRQINWRWNQIVGVYSYGFITTSHFGDVPICWIDPFRLSWCCTYPLPNHWDVLPHFKRNLGTLRTEVLQVAQTVGTDKIRKFVRQPYKTSFVLIYLDPQR